MFTEQDTASIPDLLVQIQNKLDDDDDFLRTLGHIARICNWILYGILCQLIILFGVGTNIINILCFSKQGFSDPVNVSLLGLAVADLGSLTTMIWTNVCMTPAFSDLDLPFDPFETQYVITGMPHTTFTRISALITATITIERWLCTVVPFKVHMIVTTRKVVAITVAVFIVNIASGSSVYLVYQLGMKYFPARNKTILGLVYKNDKENVENISYIINNVVFPSSAFLMIFCFTIALAINMYKTTKWRKTLDSKRIAEDSATIRNQRAAKMVIMISILFIASFTPMCAIFLFMTIHPEYNLFSKYSDIVLMMGGVAEFLESINSSMNIFIYYRMSSNYRNIFRNLFKRREWPRS